MDAPPDNQLVYDAAGVARALGLTERQFLTKRPRLQRKEGFPRPLPMTPLRWSRRLVDAWVRGEDLRIDIDPQPARNATVVALEGYRGRA